METLRAAYVVARRDFLAVIFSKAFVLFLLGPLFPVVIGGMAGALGEKAHRDLGRPQLGVAMQQADIARLLAAERDLGQRLGRNAPEIVVLKQLQAGERFDSRAALRLGNHGIGAVLTGRLEAPILTGTQERVDDWRGPVSILAAHALDDRPRAFPDVRGQYVASSAASVRVGQVVTAQAGQVALFLLTVMLAGMVLSNLVEEKSNKIIEVLAAAIPMDALFLGKLFAMLMVSTVALTIWAGAWSLAVVVGGHDLPSLPTPAVGWPAFLVLGSLYFAMAYLLLGSIFLVVGGLANTVREVQTLSMPVTMLQLMVFFFSTYAMSQPGTAVEWAAAAVPFTSPYAMIARAAQQEGLLQHLAALMWQAGWVALFIKGGAHLFRRTVMKSGTVRGRAGSSLVRRLAWRSKPS